MGLRCLFGHDFTEPELERERETSGGEVVITVREVKTCRRCGETQIVSENKEVTSVEQLAETARGIEREAAEADAPEAGEEEAPEAGEEEAPEAGEADASEAGERVDPGPETPDDEGTIIDAGDEGTAVDTADDTDDTDVGESTEVGDELEAEDGPADEDRATDPTEDDGVILDDDVSEESNRERGAWPDASDTRQGETGAETEGETPGDEDREDGEDREDATEPQPWPEQAGEDEGYDAEPGGGTPEGVSFESGLTPEAADGAAADDEGVEFIEGSVDEGLAGGGWPEHDDVATDDGEPGGDGDEGDTGGPEAMTGRDGPAEDTGFTRVDEVDDVPGDTPFETEFFCPECGHTAPADGSSMRAGDICPECRRGYIAERERQPGR